ncbi:hypothetical protein B0H13DRAFT_1564325, partial [Mycena leptocephala]
MFASVYDIFEKNSEMMGGSEKSVENSRHLVQKMVNSMSAKMEIGSPMASMYLLGNPDHYASHNYATFAWRPYVQYIRGFWMTDYQDASMDSDEDEDERVPIGRQDGKFVPTSGVDDYRYRPVVYSSLNLYEWIQCSDKKKRTPQEKASFEEEIKLAKHYKSDYYKAAMKRIDKSKKVRRHPFLPDHGLFSSHSVTCNFENLNKVIPNFIGGAISRSDKGDRAAYCMTM